jgi:Mn2+/Fe2+ NRAMP family transporter
MGIGPAVVVAAVVLGPGSITTASRVGCRFGYSMGWVVALSSALMIGMTLAALVVGVGARETVAQRLRGRFGKPITIALGLVLFLIVALFQSSNNRAMLLAAELVAPKIGQSPVAASVLLVGLNLIVVLFFLFSMNVYKIIEKVMLILVATMLVCFGINAAMGALDLGQLAAGLVPGKLPAGLSGAEISADLRAMIATTFSVGGAFYQCYLVRERGWTRDELRVRWIDPVVGISTLGLLTLLVMGTAAGELHGRVDPAEITGLTELAASLRPTFGQQASLVFASGILAGAFSSFVGNALIGGTIFSDCLGTGSLATERGPRIWTVIALLTGMTIALLSVVVEMDSVAFIVVAQGLTTLGLPMLSVALWWLLIQAAPQRAGVRTILQIVVAAGTCLAFYLAIVTVFGLVERFRG